MSGQDADLIPWPLFTVNVVHRMQEKLVNILETEVKFSFSHFLCVLFSPLQ